MSLLDLLLDHPFADDDPLVHTVASSFTKADMVERVERYAATLDVANGSPIPVVADGIGDCLLYTSPSPRDTRLSRMPSSA